MKDRITQSTTKRVDVSNLNDGIYLIRMNNGSTYEMNKLHFMDSFTGYALGAGSAILKTTDGGQNWYEIN
jgi:hypothetical protein